MSNSVGGMVKKLKMIVVAAQAKPHPSVHACTVNITTGRALVDPFLDFSNPHTYRDCMYVCMHICVYVNKNLVDRRT